MKKPAPKPPLSVHQPTVVKAPKNPHKKAKTKPIEYGPTLPAQKNYTVPIGPLPSNQNYSVPIGPEMLAELKESKPESPIVRVENGVKDEVRMVNCYYIPYLKF